MTPVQTEKENVTAVVQQDHLLRQTVLAHPAADHKLFARLNRGELTIEETPSRNFICLEPLFERIIASWCTSLC